MIIAISGSGQAAGKTTLAAKLGDETWSIAGHIRKELALKYPEYQWYNKDQAYKDKTLVKELGYSVREALYRYGQDQAAIDPTYWVDKMVKDLKVRLRIADGVKRIAIDDVRKLEELAYLREAFSTVVHYHVISENSIPEPMFDNNMLRVYSDYSLEWAP